MSVRYYQLKDGEWMRPTRKGFRDACCSCGLVHLMEFRLVDGTIEFRATVDGRATAAMRKRMNKKKKKGPNDGSTQRDR